MCIRDSFCVEPNNYVPVDEYQDCFTTGYLNALYTEIESSGSPSYEGCLLYTSRCV